MMKNSIKDGCRAGLVGCSLALAVIVATKHDYAQAQIAAGSPTASQPNTLISAGAIDTSKIPDDAVDSTKIINGAANTNKIPADAVTSTTLLRDASSLSKVSNGVIVNSGGNIGVSTSTPVAPFTIGTATGVAILANGHIETFGSPPKLSNCGAGAAVFGNDSVMNITVGAIVTSCQVTFNSVWTRAPHCFCIDDTTLGDCNVTAVSTTGITLGNIVAADDVDVLCIGIR